MEKRTKQRFVRLGLFSILAWLFTTFSLMALFSINGGLPVMATPTVPQMVYGDAVVYIERLIFDIIPALTSGYLLIGLFIFLYVERSKHDQE